MTDHLEPEQSGKDTGANPLKRYGDWRKERIDELAAMAAPRTAAQPADRTARVAAGAGGPSEDLTVSESGAVEEKPGVSLWMSAWIRLRRNPVFLLGLAITIAFILVAIFAPWIAPRDPLERYLIDQVSRQTNPVPGPQPGFPLGADNVGRDLLSRLIVGSRQTLIVGVLATLGGFIGGLVLATAVIVQYMVGGALWVEARTRLQPLYWISIGLLAAGTAGVAAWFASSTFLTSHTYDLHLPLIGAIHLSTTLWFDIGVYMLVVGATVLMLVALAHQSLRSYRRPVTAPAQGGVRVEAAAATEVDR